MATGSPKPQITQQWIEANCDGCAKAKPRGRCDIETDVRLSAELQQPLRSKPAIRVAGHGSSPKAICPERMTKDQVRAAWTS
jgi:hypothetical protein